MSEPAGGASAVFTLFAKKNEKGPSAPGVKAGHGGGAAGRDEYRKANAAFYIGKAERLRRDILAAKGELYGERSYGSAPSQGSLMLRSPRCGRLEAGGNPPEKARP